MKRRDFITLLGGAAAWPLAARAQQRAQPMRRVGWLTAFAEDDPEGTARIAAFRQTLADLGLARGRLSQRGVIATAFSVLEFAGVISESCYCFVRPVPVCPDSNHTPTTQNIIPVRFDSNVVLETE